MPYFTTGAELDEPGSKVVDRRTHHRIQVLNVQIPPLDVEQPRMGDRQPSGPTMVAVDEGTCFRPIGVTSRVSCAEVNVFCGSLAEVPYDLEVTEFLQAVQSALGEFFVEPNGGPHTSPVIISHFGTAIDDGGDRGERDLHRAKSLFQGAGPTQVTSRRISAAR